MGRFNKGKKRKSPGINTSALPDIIFMLLFFFMVATTMKEVEMQVTVIKPVASQAQKLEDKDNVDFIYVGYPIKQEEGAEPRIQLDDQLALSVESVGPWKVSQVREGMAIHEVVTSLKIHRDVGMQIVYNLKEELRKVDAVRINYSADQQ